MKADQVTDYLQNIGEWILDEDKILTYKWLSKTLSVHVNTAKQLLFAYLSEQKDKSLCSVSATYLLAGKLKDGNHCVTVVNQDDLKTAYENFQEITSEHVYSIQKVSSVKDFQILYAANRSASDSEGFGSPIKCSKSVPRPKNPVAHTRRDDGEKPVQATVQSGAKQKEKIQVNEEEEKTKGSDKGTASLKNSAPTSSGRDASKEKKTFGNKKIGNIANFFGNAAAASKRLKPKEEPEIKGDNVAEKPENESKTSGVAKGNKETRDPPKKAIPKKKSSEPERSSKKKKKVEDEGKKRKRIKVFSDSEDSESESCRDGSPSPMNVDEMEVEPESEVVVQEDRTEVEPEPTAQNKRKKRKIVDKTVMSEDGYIETKKEVVYETDSENEEKPAEKLPTDRVQDATKRASPPKKGKPNTKQPANSKKQSSLYSFFKKN